MPNQKGFSPLIVLFTCLLVAGLIGGAYYLGTQKNQFTIQNNQQVLPSLPVQVQKAQNTSPSPTTDSKISQTSTWRTITRTNWEFKIPNDWRYWECSADTIFVGPQIEKDQAGECAFDYNPGVVAIYKVNPPHKTLEEAVPKTEEQILDYGDGRKGIVRSPLISGTQYLIVDNQKAIYWQEEIKAGQGEGTYLNMYVLSKSSQFQLDDLKYKDSFDLILSTIKFLK